MPDRLYLDHAATTPIIPAARKAMVRGFEIWANPSSPHGAGRAARAELEEARSRIGAALQWDGDIILTSGATEAIGIAMKRVEADAMLISATEHDAVLRESGRGYVLPVGEDGSVRVDVVTGRLGALGAEHPFLAIQTVNNETGVVQPLASLLEPIRRARGVLLADASQSAGKLALPDADLIAISAHKFGGPPGVGALLVRDLSLLKATGGQERGYRGGTENLPAVLGMAAALEASRGWLDRAADLRAHLDGAVEASGGQVVARAAQRIATIASYWMPGVSAAAQLIRFDLAGIAISAGSACSSGSLKPSHVLGAMGWSDAAATEVVRVSFGPETSRADVYRFVETWRRIAQDKAA